MTIYTKNNQMSDFCTMELRHSMWLSGMVRAAVAKILYFVYIANTLGKRDLSPDVIIKEICRHKYIERLDFIWQRTDRAD